jgi:hypothetical protein
VLPQGGLAVQRTLLDVSWRDAQPPIQGPESGFPKRGTRRPSVRRALFQAGGSLLVAALWLATGVDEHDTFKVVLAALWVILAGAWGLTARKRLIDRRAITARGATTPGARADRP